MKRIITLNVNGDDYEVAVKPNDTLLDVIRYELKLTGTKKGCDIGTCGVCTVIMDGEAVLSCLILALDAQGHKITTIEGISTEEELHPVQKAFIEKGAIQCGFCTPGIVMTAKALLDNNPTPSDEEIREALAGTFCRCTGHIKIIEAIKSLIPEQR
ncbi:MAG: (2Fe-2S)-binding protein [Candidatus Schekmanbacteria bacterium]|nr:MAG: (2Fe-2S)-binding protein [Candidatus Schekmanbacteria bacterium]